jgi:hypothetical protein
MRISLAAYLRSAMPKGLGRRFDDQNHQGVSPCCLPGSDPVCVSWPGREDRGRLDTCQGRAPLNRRQTSAVTTRRIPCKATRITIPFLEGCQYLQDVSGRCASFLSAAAAAGIPRRKRRHSHSFQFPGPRPDSSSRPATVRGGREAIQEWPVCKKISRQTPNFMIVPSFTGVCSV